MENTRNILREYEEMTAAEKAQVDAIVADYKSGASDKPYVIQTSEVTDDKGNIEYTGEKSIGTMGRITSDDVMNYISKFAGHINEVNEKLKTTEYSQNKQQNEMRQKLFEDRCRNGYYNQENKPMNPAPVNVNVNTNTSSDEVKQLKQEISDLKQGMNDMMELLKEKLK